MNFPDDFDDAQIAQYEAIFASGDGELLLQKWEAAYQWSASGGHPPHPIDFGAFYRAIAKDGGDFAIACVDVLPARFFDLNRPLRCRDNEEPEREIYERLKRARTAPSHAAYCHLLVERMVQRGWDPMYAAPPGADRRRVSMLYLLSGIEGTTPLLRRLSAHVGVDALRQYSDSRCRDIAQTQTTQTLLHRAVETQDLDMVRFLVEEVGLDPNTGDGLGRTALMANLWILSGNPESAKLARNRELARELIELGLNIEHKDSQANTALVYAVQTANAQAVQFLLDAGADPTVRSGPGESLLEISEADGSEEVARILRSLELGRSLAEAMDGVDGRMDAPRASGGLTL